jgi:hypothetical protein
MRSAAFLFLHRYCTFSLPKKFQLRIVENAKNSRQIAPLAPTILPVQTWAAIAVVRAWKELMPPCCAPPFVEESFCTAY